MPFKSAKAAIPKSLMIPIDDFKVKCFSAPSKNDNLVKKSVPEATLHQDQTISN